MEDKILVNLSTDANHTFECETNIIGREGEGNTSRFEITVPEKLKGCSVYLDFEKPNGEKLRTPELKMENGVAVYDVVAYILADDGEVKVQAVLQTSSGQIWKSSIKSYFNQNSINALEETPQKEDLLTEIQRVLDELNDYPTLSRTVQTTGESTTDVMSQKATTEEFNKTNTQITEMTARITNLENKALSFVTDEDIAYVKHVPENALPYALISKIGGMSYKSKNLFNIVGVNFSNNVSLGSMQGEKINATYKENTQYTFSWVSTCTWANSSSSYLYMVVYYTDGTNSGYSYYVARQGDNKKRYTWTTASGKTVNYIQFTYSDEGTFLFENPSLVEGTSIMSPYEPYFSGLRDAKVTKVKSIDGGDTLTWDGNTEGKLVIPLGEGFSACKLSNSVPKQEDCANKEIYLSLVENGEISQDTISGNDIAFGEDGVGLLLPVLFFIPTDNYVTDFGVFLEKGTYVMFVDGVAYVSSLTIPGYTGFVKEISTLTIPESVQSLEGYGQSNPDNADEYNYIDLVNQKFVTRGRIVNGVWETYSSTEDIDIPEIISVEGGGTLTFENEYGYDVPSEVYYQLEGVAE